MRTWTRLVTTFMCAGGVSLAAGCGDDGGGGGDDDPDPIDAMVDMEPEIDAPPTADRAMSVAVVEVALTSPQGVAAGIKGGLISIEFSDLTSGGGEVLTGTNPPIGTCLVTRHDAQNPPNPLVDAGTVTVATGEDSAEELGMTVGPCSYQTGQGYLCISHAGAGVSATGTPVAGGVVSYTMPSQDFGDGLRGSYLNIGGFTANMSLNAAMGPFPIVRQIGTTSLDVINLAGTGTPETSDVTFAVINGAGPIPTSGVPFDFLHEADSTVRISKGDHDNWPAFDYTLFHRGEGFTLDAESAQPHEFPAKADGPWVFSCDGKGGICGDDGEVAEGEVPALIISGRTTDVTIPQGVPDYWMPPASMATTYASFQCAFLLQDIATVPEAAVEAILSTNPTRIETRVLRVVGRTPMEGLNSGRVLVGHGLVGHTTL